MSPKQKKISISVTLPKDLIDFLSTKVESREFASFAHGIELCVIRYRDTDGRLGLTNHGEQD